MGTINWRRVVTGGLVAGIVMVVVWLPVLVILSADITTAIASLGLSVEPSERLILYGGTAGLSLGIVTVFIYAAIRPRYGPGPRTAVIAGLTSWFITAIVDAGWATLGVIS